MSTSCENLPTPAGVWHSAVAARTTDPPKGSANFSLAVFTQRPEDTTAEGTSASNGIALCEDLGQSFGVEGSGLAGTSRCY